MQKRFFDLQKLDGLWRVVEETANFDRIIRGVYKLTAKEVYGNSKTPKIAVFAYGSPGRIELVGGDSDADIFLIEEIKTEKSERFKKLLKQKLSFFDFSKVDMPDWGTFNEIDTYLTKSLIEGNQILETRFLIGDETIEKEVKAKKQKFGSDERLLKNIIFNRLYLNQYFRQRTKNGAPNIKYCKGGSRDFLFVYWYDKLDRVMGNEKDDLLYRPQIEKGLKRLFIKGKITGKELDDVIEAVNFMMVLRSDVLRLNKNTSDKGLTFLDKKTLKKLETIGYPIQETITAFEKYRKYIDRICRIILEETIKKATTNRDSMWEQQFRLAYKIETPELTRKEIPHTDQLMRIALLWGASEANQKELFDYLVEKYKNTEDWAMIGSIVCSLLCDPKILHHFGTGQAKEVGYGYLLRVIARNKNVKRETLESIANDSMLNIRYREVAKAALNGGYNEANRQI